MQAIEVLAPFMKIHKRPAGNRMKAIKQKDIKETQEVSPLKQIGPHTSMTKEKSVA